MKRFIFAGEVWRRYKKRPSEKHRVKQTDFNKCLFIVLEVSKQAEKFKILLLSYLPFWLISCLENEMNSRLLLKSLQVEIYHMSLQWPVTYTCRQLAEGEEKRRINSLPGVSPTKGLMVVPKICNWKYHPRRGTPWGLGHQTNQQWQNLNKMEGWLSVWTQTTMPARSVEWGLEYAKCIPYRRKRLSPLKKNKKTDNSRYSTKLHIIMIL